MASAFADVLMSSCKGRDRPWRNALRLDFNRPAAVLGPVLFCAFARLAAICRSVAMVLWACYASISFGLSGVRVAALSLVARRRSRSLRRTSDSLRSIRRPFSRLTLMRSIILRPPLRISMALASICAGVKRGRRNGDERVLAEMQEEPLHSDAEQPDPASSRNNHRAHGCDFEKQLEHGAANPGSQSSVSLDTQQCDKFRVCRSKQKDRLKAVYL
jgi:hypothetical protein